MNDHSFNETGIHLPLEPMVPIADENVPEGEDWGYQLKWDGVRIIAAVHDGHVTLFSRQGKTKNNVYPEIVAHLRTFPYSCLLDGEVVAFDPDVQRPVFQKVLQRERLGKGELSTYTPYPVTYVLFDLLAYEQDNLMKTPYTERYEQLRSLFPENHPSLLVTDLYDKWEPLWNWVLSRGWEGIVSKRLSAPYRSGKRHHDAYKKKIHQQFDVMIVGVTYHLDRLASLIMSRHGAFFGKVSLGLNQSLRHRLDTYAIQHQTSEQPWNPMPKELRSQQHYIIWLQPGIAARVQGLEVTTAGFLRHPKIIQLALLGEGRDE